MTDTPSIFEHIEAHLDEVGLRPGGDRLPDDPTDDDAVTWAPGAADGVVRRHTMFWSPDEETIAALHQALVDLADRPSRDRREQATAVMRSTDPFENVEGLAEKVMMDPPRDIERLRQEMREIARNTGDRREAKYVISLLGRFQPAISEDADLLRTFARHDEFTLYAAVALQIASEDPVREWLDLAPHVPGWGRIALVDLLLSRPDRGPEACAYLLRGGFRNTIHPSYTALPIAQGCDLLAALMVDEPDTDLVDGALELLHALAADAYDGPGGGMSDYPDGVRATERLLDVIPTAEAMRSQDFRDQAALAQRSLPALRTLLRFTEERFQDTSVSDEHTQLHESYAPGWSFEARQRIATRLYALIRQQESCINFCLNRDPPGLFEVLDAIRKIKDRLVQRPDEFPAITDLRESNTSCPHCGRSGLDLQWHELRTDLQYGWIIIASFCDQDNTIVSFHVGPFKKSDGI